jgi:SAM-dependent methyltransferase
VTLVACRSCGAPEPRTFLDLGKTPLADALVPADSKAPLEEQFPLAVAFCPECSLVQVTEEVSPQKLFVDNYLYFSSFSPALLEHARRHADWLIDSCGLDERSFVVEVASNDGYLLRNFAERGIPVLGIDPAPGQAAAARGIGVPTREDFFGPELARELRGQRPADVIVANNVMAHTPDLNGFVEGLAELLADDGLATIENAYVRDLIDHCEFDTIYHEHFCYFSCTAVDRLMSRHGLCLYEVEHLPLHGGSLRWHVSKRPRPRDSVERMLAAESEAGLDTYDYYSAFGARVECLKRDLLAVLQRLRAEGARIAAYGAAAKGATLLNYVGIDATLVDYVVDRNVHKQGHLMPGVRLPIHPPERLLEDRPDYVLLLAWNFKEEILAQQSEYRAAGGRFVVPVPNPELV